MASATATATWSATILIGPLTTTFTPPADCDLLSVWINPIPADSTTFTWFYEYDISWPSGGHCFPSGRPTGSFNADDYYYSPGLCPHGWTSYQDSAVKGIETNAICCPPGHTTTTDIDVAQTLYTYCISTFLTPTTVTAVVLTATDIGLTSVTSSIHTVTDFVVTRRGIGAPPFNIKYKAGDFSPATPTSPAPQPTSPKPTSPIPEPATADTGLSSAAKLGLGIGIPAVIILLAAILGFTRIRRCYRNYKIRHDEPDVQVPERKEETPVQPDEVRREDVVIPSFNKHGAKVLTIPASPELAPHLDKPHGVDASAPSKPEIDYEEPHGIGPSKSLSTNPLKHMENLASYGIIPVTEAVMRDMTTTSKTVVANPRRIPLMTALHFTSTQAPNVQDKTTLAKIQAIKEFNAPVYRDNKLSSTRGQIRLAVISSVGDTIDDIKIQLEPSPIQSYNSTYEALSYSWGDQSEVLIIKVNGKPFKATTNLVSAIRHILQKAPVVKIWIDAICINQADKIEKNSQLPQMRDIYKNASTTWVWLGEGTVESDLAIYHLKQAIGRGSRNLENLGTNEMENFLVIRGMNESFLRNKFAEELEAEFRSHPLLHRYIGEMVKRDWFQRLWVIQEVIVSSKPQALCGHQSISFWAITEAFGMLLDHQSRPNLPTSLTVSSIMNDRIALLGNFRDHDTKGEALDLAIWLQVFGTSQKCFDPRDRIFALLGLAADGTVPSLTRLMNYELSEAFIYTKTTEHIILRTMDLEIIFAGRGIARATDLPSWVPDFRLGPFDSALSLQRSAFGPGQGFSASGNRYLTLDSQLSDHQIPPGQQKYQMPEGKGPQFLDPNTLVVSCIQVDTVDQVGQEYVFKSSLVNDENGRVEISEADRLHHSAILREVVTLAFGKDYPHGDVHLAKPYPRLNTIYEDALARTLVCDLNPDGSRRKTEPAQFDFSTAGPVEPVLDPLDTSPVISDFHLRGRRIRRCFMRSKDGLIGLVPAGAQKGDLIFVLFGCSVPVILRGSDKPNCYMLVGESYVHGIMDGEVVRNLEEGILQERRIHLI